MKRLYTLAALLAGAAPVFAQTAAPAAEGTSLKDVVLLLAVATVVVALACLMMAIAVFYLIRKEAPAPEPAAAAQESWLTRLWLRMNTFKPVEMEEEVAMDHEYDGIRELDNSLPPWWVWGFYITIGISVVYLYYYHVSDSGWSSANEYKNEIAEAQATKDAYLAKAANLVDENTVQMADASGIASGKTIYTERCVACHGAAGEGGIGPNLTDTYWLHGGSIKDLFKVVKYGVPEKGMQPWEGEITPAQMQQVSSFILSLQGTNPPNAKEPQGDPYQPEQAAPAADTTKAVAQIK